MNLQIGTSVGSFLASSSWNKKSIVRMKVKKNMMKCLFGERRKLPVFSFPTKLCAQGSYNHFYNVAWDRLHAGICECLLSQLEGLQVTRVKIQVVTLFGGPTLRHDPLVLLLQCTHTDVVINSELHWLSGKSNHHISLSASTKALGGLFYGYGSGKLKTKFLCFLALGDWIQIETNKVF